jgi:pimeloyl-ACP methyl ester carboxylesterase
MVPARIALAILAYRPGRRLGRITTPTLVCVCDPDTVAPNQATERHIRRAANPRITARTYPCGHFDIYLGEPFERAVADQVEFLRAALGARAAVATAPARGQAGP